MLFEEFFKKKKINLQTFEQGEPGLFSEFKIHYEQMGEKSFDHTKKYWFNKLRLRFPAPIEPKVEKEVIENRLAEQTITESLVESSTPAPKVGFKPMFRAGAKPAAQEPEKKEEPIATESTETPTPPAVGFKPRFKAGVTKPAESGAEKKEEEPKPDTPTSAPAVGFKPRFKAGVTKPAEPKEEPKAEEAPKEESTDQPKPAVGFKPRFKAGVTKPVATEPGKKEEEPTPPDPPVPIPSIGFKPRFKAGVTKPAAPEKKDETKSEE
ncbi:MAG TPA: hypothetical protein VK668_07230 [Mucilaginibacter sp.]|nr:hypothetical protein [Mucilaginibacter sp.]